MWLGLYNSSELRSRVGREAPSRLVGLLGRDAEYDLRLQRVGNPVGSKGHPVFVVPQLTKRESKIDQSQTISHDYIHG